MINVLSLFDGCSCCHLALDRAGIEVDKYYAAEIDKYAITVTQANYPSTIQMGDVTKWREWDINWSSIDLVTGGFPCFAAGTLVTTKNGLKPIEQIKRGDEVITHNHRFKKVVIPMMKIADHYNLVKIQGSHELKVTDEHPFYVREMNKSWNNALRRNVRSFSEPKWVDCKNLNTSHFIGVPVNQNSIDPAFSIDIGFWYMIGRYLADGYSSTTNKHSRGKDSNKSDRRVYKTIITCGKHEEQQMDDIVSRVKYNPVKNVEATSIKYTISNKELWEFVQYFGRGAENKQIPQFLFDAPIEVIKAFLDGYISGDGCLIHSDGYKRNKSMSQITTVSEKLAYGVIQLIQKAYRTQPSITKAKVAPSKVIEGRVINQKPFFTVRFYKAKPKFAKYYEEGGFIWTPFKSKLRISEELPVYNFEVEDDNSYAVNNLIVHNCQAWSVAGKQQGDKDERGMLFWTMLDIMKHVLRANPRAKFLMENVKMKREFERYITHHTEAALGKVFKILINSALVSAQNRQRYYWTNWQVTQPEDKGIVLADIIENGEVDRDKSHCVDANYAKGGNLKSYFEKNRRQLVFNPAAIRGRYIVDGKRQDGKMLVAGLTQQMLEVKDGNKSNALTTVQKDNVLSTMKPGRYPLIMQKGRGNNSGGLRALDGKTPSMTSCSWQDNNHLTNGIQYRKLTPVECERLQTMPDQFTAHVSNTQRYKMIGNAWTVDVIAHIFSHIEAKMVLVEKQMDLFGEVA